MSTLRQPGRKDKCKHDKVVGLGCSDTEAMVCLECDRILIREYIRNRVGAQEVLAEVNYDYAAHVREKYEERIKQAIEEKVLIPKPVKINYLKHNCGRELNFIDRENYLTDIYYCPECDLLILHKTDDGSNTPLTPEATHYDAEQCKKIRDAHAVKIEPLKEYTSKW
jgi:hypothetical protein